MYPQLQLVPSSQVNNNPTRCNSYAQKQEDPPKLVWSKLEHEYIEEGLMPQCVECNCELGFNNTRQLCHKSYCKALRETEDTVHEFGGRPSFRMHMIRKKNIMKPMFSQAAYVLNFMSLFYHLLGLLKRRRHPRHQSTHMMRLC